MFIRNEALEALLGSTRRQRTVTLAAAVVVIGFTAGLLAELFFDGLLRVMVATALVVLAAVFCGPALEGWRRRGADNAVSRRADRPPR